MKITILLLLAVLNSFLFPSSLLAGQYYLLCEGNFGQANASLWSFDESLSQIEGPLLWNASTNPLGDVGQSLTLFEHTLYMVMNNSHQIRKVNLDPTPVHSGDIELPGSSPRYLAVHGGSGLGYVSCWNLGAILIIDMARSVVVDTLVIGALPEEILIQGDDMYVSVPLTTSWNGENEVRHYDISGSEPQFVHSYEVMEGPGSMVISNQVLYVTSIFYEAGETMSGSSSIDLITQEVHSVEHGLYPNFTADIHLLGEIPYRTFGNRVVPLDPTLALQFSEGIGDLPGIYSFSLAHGNLVLGASDFMAPDPVSVLSPAGDLLASFTVGALPSDCVYYDPETVATRDLDTRPLQWGLSQNYPNPFNPSTSIPFILQEQGPISLRIYDLQGRLIRTVAKTEYPAGLHILHWDGKDFRGRSVPGGIYHAVLQSSSNRDMIKMSLLR